MDSNKYCFEDSLGSFLVYESKDRCQRLCNSILSVGFDESDFEICTAASCSSQSCCEQDCVANSGFTASCSVANDYEFLTTTALVCSEYCTNNRTWVAAGTTAASCENLKCLAYLETQFGVDSSLCLNVEVNGDDVFSSHQDLCTNVATANYYVTTITTANLVTATSYGYCDLATSNCSDDERCCMAKCLSTDHFCYAISGGFIHYTSE